MKTEASWHVWKDDKVYGPYTTAQLASFIGPDTLVHHGVHSPEWTEASKVAVLEEVLSGGVGAGAEWIVRIKGSERPAMTRSALVRFIERGEISPSDSVRHLSWESFVPLGETKLYARLKAGETDLSRLDPRDLGVRPRKAAGREGAGVRGDLSPANKWFPRSLVARIAAGIIALCLIYLFVDGIGYLSSNAEDDIHAEYGVPSGDCLSDPVSRSICAERALYCGCGEKGSCGMPSCEMLAEMIRAAEAER